MKKMIYLMLTLIVLSAASVNAQVRIGGTADPDKSAVLDLNANDGTATGGLALPRVALTSETQTLNGVEPKPGTVVYNTSTELDGEGTYVWTKVGSGSGTDFTGISVAEGTGTTVTGTGTTASPLKVDIATDGVTTELIKDGQVTAAKLNAMGASNGQVLKYSNGIWAAGADNDTKDGGILRLSGSRGITTTPSGDAVEISLPVGIALNSVLAWNGSAWAPASLAITNSQVELPALEGNTWLPHYQITDRPNAINCWFGAAEISSYMSATKALYGWVMIPREAKPIALTCLEFVF
jgi:hypothetical protein